MFSRFEKLVGKSTMDKLYNAKVILFGVGGVGSYVAEALVRSGVGEITLVDPDDVALSNINRQLVALKSTIGRNKAEVMRDRLIEINPSVNAVALRLFYSAETAARVDLSKYDYIIDAIDSVSSKLHLITTADALNVPVISSMGAGNKLNPTGFIVADIFSTTVCPLARVMRKELKQCGVKKLKVVYSKEEAIKPLENGEAMPNGKRQIPGSAAFVPSVAGLIIASEVIKDLAGLD